MSAAAIAAQMLASAVVGAFVFIALEDQLTAVLARLTGGWSPRGRRHTRGIWYSTFWHQSSTDGRVRSVTSIVRIRGIGSRIVADSRTGAVAFNMTGNLTEGTYLTATWRNSQSGNVYQGACQFHLSPEGDQLTGRWLGWNKRQQIGSGPWLMTRIDRHTSKRAVIEAGSAFAAGSISTNRSSTAPEAPTETGWPDATWQDTVADEIEPA